MNCQYLIYYMKLYESAITDADLKEHDVDDANNEHSFR